MHYNKLLEEAKKENVEVVKRPLAGRLKGLYADNVIALNENLETTAEKACVLAEELGHYSTSVGDILDQSIIENRKQELKARRWAVGKLIRVEDFIVAFNEGVRSRNELAEFLGVTENFIDTALNHFQNLYGYCITIENYTVHFSPLYVYKSFI